MEFGGQGGDNHFGISEGKGGGVKMLMPPVVGYGYFLESPNETPHNRNPRPVNLHDSNSLSTVGHVLKDPLFPLVLLTVKKM